MSYDLDFWKYKQGVYLNNQEVYERCSDGELVEGLEILPIEDIKKEISRVFPDWTVNEQGDTWNPPKGKEAFQLFYTSQFVRFDCYGIKGKDMNRIIDVMLSFDCPLYDPQVPQRFDEQ